MMDDECIIDFCWEWNSLDSNYNKTNKILVATLLINGYEGCMVTVKLIKWLIPTSYKSGQAWILNITHSGQQELEEWNELSFCKETMLQSYRLYMNALAPCICNLPPRYMIQV